MKFVINLNIESFYKEEIIALELTFNNYIWEDMSAKQCGYLTIIYSVLMKRVSITEYIK